MRYQVIVIARADEPDRYLLVDTNITSWEGIGNPVNGAVVADLSNGPFARTVRDALNGAT